MALVTTSHREALYYVISSFILKENDKGSWTARAIQRRRRGELRGAVTVEIGERIPGAGITSRADGCAHDPVAGQERGRIDDTAVINVRVHELPVERAYGRYPDGPGRLEQGEIAARDPLMTPPRRIRPVGVGARSQPDFAARAAHE